MTEGCSRLSNPRPVVHLELHTSDRARAAAFYTQLFRWRPELIRVATGSYLSLPGGGGVGGGVVECDTRRPVWLRCVEVGRNARPTERAGRLGATFLLEPSAGPAGLRSVISSPEGGEVAFWQPRR